MAQSPVTVTLQQQSDYQFAVHFGAGLPALLVDEPPPLGQGLGPSPLQLLAAAVGNCLSDSLLFALKKFKQNPEPIRTEVQATVGRNDQGRMRVQRIDVTLNLGCPAAQLEHLDRVVAQFEDFCTVTQSVAQGLEVVTRVQDSQGLVVKG
jgi:uncharacterized OsmC-like protein